MSLGVMRGMTLGAVEFVWPYRFLNGVGLSDGCGCKEGEVSQNSGGGAVDFALWGMQMAHRLSPSRYRQCGQTIALIHQHGRNYRVYMRNILSQLRSSRG